MVDETMVDEHVDIFKDDEMSNEAQDKVEGSKLLLAPGWYNTTGDMTQTNKVNDAGRRVARFFGSIERGEVQSKIGFGVSPDLVYKPGTDTPDFMYGQYLQAKRAYKKAAGVERDEAVSIKAVLAYLRESAIQVRIVQTQDGENMVVAIRAAQA